MKKKYLIVKGCAGIGNRLATVVAAIQYCDRNNRILVIDWADGQLDEKGLNAFHTCFVLQNFNRYATIDEIENWDRLSHSSELFKADRHAGLYDLYVHKSNSFFNRLPVKFFPKGWFRTLREKWQPLKPGSAPLCFGNDLPDNLPFDIVYFVDFLPVIQYEQLVHYINLQPRMQAIVNDYAAARRLNEAIGLHVRFTDKKPEKKLSLVINYLKKHKGDTQLFLCTDSAEVETLFRENFEDVILYPKNLPVLSGEGLHQWALYNNEEKLKRKMYEESIAEMFLLSKCGKLLYQGNSTFSLVSKAYHAHPALCKDWQLL